MISCETVNSRVPLNQEYNKEEQKALAAELDDRCPITKDKFGNEISSCPMIDKVIADYFESREIGRIK